LKTLSKLIKQIKERAAAEHHLAVRGDALLGSAAIWAGTQNNLGTALERLGERESGTASLEANVAPRPSSGGRSAAEPIPIYSEAVAGR
jgi:hypothetical protein